MPQRGITGTEIVDRQLHPHLLDGRQQLDRLLRIMDYHPFGDFQFQQLRRHAGILQHRGNVTEQMRVCKLAYR